jgi:hypothetical protein
VVLDVLARQRVKGAPSCLQGCLTRWVLGNKVALQKKRRKYPKNLIWVIFFQLFNFFLLNERIRKLLFLEIKFEGKAKKILLGNRKTSVDDGMVGMKEKKKKKKKSHSKSSHFPSHFFF